MMELKKVLFKQLRVCIDKIESVFGDQFALCVKLTKEGYLDLTVVVFIESAEGIKQVQVTTLLDDPKKYPDYTIWAQSVIDALRDAILEATTEGASH